MALLQPKEYCRTEPGANAVTDTVTSPEPDSDPDPIAYTTIHTEPEPNTTVVYSELDFEHDPEFTTVPDIFI